MSRSTTTYLISNSDYDIKKDMDNIAMLVIDNTLTLCFHRAEDLADFILVVNELEIANDTFQADREEPGALA